MSVRCADQQTADLSHARIKFACPHCQQHIEAGPRYAGLKITCPACRNSLLVPSPPIAPAPPPAFAAKRMLGLIGIAAVLLGVGGYFGWGLVKKMAS